MALSHQLVSGLTVTNRRSTRKDGMRVTRPGRSRIMDDLIYLLGIALSAFLGTMVALFVFYSGVLDTFFANEVMGYVDVYKADDMQT